VKKYQIIYADPPWEFGDRVVNRGHGGKFEALGDIHYPTLSLDNLRRLPIRNITDSDCALFIWSTDSHIPNCLDLIDSWGFTYKTIAFYWLKMDKWNMKPVSNLGKWTQKNIEPCLFATRGKMSQHLKDRSVCQLIMFPRAGHSSKPDIARENIVRLFGDLPRIELFARRKVEGWDCWGNEIESDIVLPNGEGEVNGIK